MTKSLTVHAPAKLNLFLHVVGRRDDGMHELQTLFRLVNLYDELTFEVTAEALTLTGDMAADDNLVMRAARLLRERTGTAGGARIRLAKRIPVEAGLGGGSSDAAATLLALNVLWQTGLDTAALEALGLELGADVPLFVRGVNAFGEGGGERLTPVQLPPEDYLLVRPDCSVATGAIFSDPSLTRNTPLITISRLLRATAVGQSVDPVPRNDLELIVRRLYPAVDAAVVWASQYGPAKMTGSGSCVFVPLTATIAEALREEAEWLSELPAGWQAYVVQGIGESPVLGTLNGF